MAELICGYCDKPICQYCGKHLSEPPDCCEKARVEYGEEFMRAVREQEEEHGGEG